MIFEVAARNEYLAWFDSIHRPDFADALRGIIGACHPRRARVSAIHGTRIDGAVRSRNIIRLRTMSLQHLSNNLKLLAGWVIRFLCQLAASPGFDMHGIRRIAVDEPSVPPQDGVWQSGSRFLAEGFATQSMTDFAERYSLGV
jgi:hypothetical protein